MEQIKTKDSSFTFYSEEYKESYHSVSGALEESLKKFVEPCKIKEGMKILDIGFGLGYNVGKAMLKAKRLMIVSLEKDPKVLNSLDKIKIPKHFEEVYNKVKVCAKNLDYKDKDYEIKIILGDAVETIKTIKEKFDAVFLDGFSPSKNPELWNLDFLKDVKKKMNKNGILSTYSCAGKFRRDLRLAGFKVTDGPVVGRRAPGTIAIK